MQNVNEILLEFFTTGIGTPVGIVVIGALLLFIGLLLRRTAFLVMRVAGVIFLARGLEGYCSAFVEEFVYTLLRQSFTSGNLMVAIITSYVAFPLFYWLVISIIIVSSQVLAWRHLFAG